MHDGAGEQQHAGADLHDQIAIPAASARSLPRAQIRNTDATEVPSQNKNRVTRSPAKTPPTALPA